MSDKSTDKHDDVSHRVVEGQEDDSNHATPPAGPSSELEPAQQQQQTEAASHNKRTKKKKRKKRQPLHWVPLSALPREEKLALCRAAIAAGADVNGLDDSEPECHREGRPLDACFRISHMPPDATYFENLHVIKLLLDHGADPRLRGLWWDPVTPLHHAIYEVEKYGEKTGSRWDRVKTFSTEVLAMFREAIARLEEKEEREKGEKMVESGKNDFGEEKSGEEKGKNNEEGKSDGEEKSTQRDL